MTRRGLGGHPTGAASSRTWRATTAVRVFALALATGQSLGADSLERSGAVLFTLALIAMVSAVLEAGLPGRRSPWIPVVEGILVATLLTTSLQVATLLIYLAVPPVVAGLRHGWVTTINTCLSSGVAVIAASVGYQDLGLAADRLTSAYPWLTIGLGAGLLAAWQSRSVRRLEATQAPYATAHHLLAELHALTQHGRVGLDSPTVARELAETMSTETSATGASVFLRSMTGGLEPCVHVGEDHELASLAAKCEEAGRAVMDGSRAALLLGVQDEKIGVLALQRGRAWTSGDLREHQLSVDHQALPLQTALLFDDVRLAATSEERNRLAREIHDGVAQEMVALGYLADELESQTSEPAALRTAAELRNEIARVVSELRFSIYDLRHELTDQDLVGALSEYVRQMTTGTDLRVHLSFNEQGPTLSQRVQAEVLRIAQEAINNVRKHAHAINLWVSFATDGDTVNLLVEDDGVGCAGPRDRHYGMHTMRERAERIDAELNVTERRDGGTIVSLRFTTHPSIGGDRRHEHSSPAGR